MMDRYNVSMAWGMAIGALTFAAGPIGWTSANPIIAAFQWVLTMLMVPGLIGAAFIGSLGVGAIINVLFHFGLCWVLFSFFSRFRRRVKS
jgi:hypothetical protein